MKKAVVVENIMSQDYWLQSFINENNIRDDCWQNAEHCRPFCLPFFLVHCFNNDKCFSLLSSTLKDDDSEIYFKIKTLAKAFNDVVHIIMFKAFQALLFFSIRILSNDN